MLLPFGDRFGLKVVVIQLVLPDAAGCDSATPRVNLREPGLSARIASGSDTEALSTPRISAALLRRARWNAFRLGPL